MAAQLDIHPCEFSPVETGDGLYTGKRAVFSSMERVDRTIQRNIVDRVEA
jgi:hypothetical protein